MATAHFSQLASAAEDSRICSETINVIAACTAFADRSLDLETTDPKPLRKRAREFGSFASISARIVVSRSWVARK